MLISEDESALEQRVGEWTSFQIFRLEGDFRNTIPSSQDRILPRETSLRPDFPECIALIQDWLDQCERTHTTCLRPDAMAMPTRVIDVGLLGGHTTPKLLLTQSRRERYVTLSYCWGNDGSVVTTTENFARHMEAIDLQSLPTTLRDAVIVTRLLGFRYLWIDALCIIQDDPVDWKRESATMCAVYEGATLSLSASHSPSSNSGFLGSRERSPQYFKNVTLEGTGLSIGRIAEMALDTVANSPLEARAWALQERVLARALVHFTSEQLTWECCAGVATEVEPTIGTPKQTIEHVDFGYSVHHMKRMMYDQSNIQDASLWYNLVEQLTRRSLTKSTDRLPAMAGLISRFERRLGDKGVFGIWEKELHVGLMWSKVKQAEVPAHGISDDCLREQGMPSWSWLSVDAPVKFTCQTDCRKLVLRADIEPVEGDNCLRISCQRVAGVCYRDTGRYTCCRFLANDALAQSDGIACQLDDMNEKVQPGGLIPKVYHCLLIAQEEHEGSVDFEYLIAEKVNNESDLGAVKTYRRAGVG